MSRVELTEDERRLLARMALGESIKKAAASVHMSLRTANRRLSGLRKRTGAEDSRDLVSLLYRNA